MISDFVIQPVEISADILYILKDFTCGVDEMDEILHSPLFVAELNTDNPRGFLIKNGMCDLIGVLIIGETSVPIEYEKEKTSYLDMVDIACLAIHKDFQYKKIGTAILNWVCSKANDFIPDVEYLHVDALDLQDGSYSAVPFYERFGFQYIDRSGVDTARMVYALH